MFLLSDITLFQSPPKNLLLVLVLISSVASRKDFASAVSHKREPLCSMSSFERCMGTIKAVMESDKLAFASTVNELDSACRKLQEGVRCSDEHMQQCVSKNQRTVFEEVVAGTRLVLSKLCVRGKLQQDYLRFASCYKNVSLSEEKCAPWFKTMQQLDTQMQNDNVDAGLKKFCCAFSQAHHCQVYHLRQDCGQEAIDFYDTNLKEMSMALIQKHCEGFTYDSCVEDQKSHTSSTLPRQYSAAAFVITFFLYLLMH